MNSYASNIQSQNGEDGILSEILHRLNISDGWVCEFGAWDGKHLSNTFKLIQEGFQGVFIEGDPDKQKDLEATVEEYPNITPVCAQVTESGDTSLETLLAQTEIPFDFDVLSIDIDSSDYQVWRGLQNQSPKVVVIEINSSIPPPVRYVQGQGSISGSSFQSMLELGQQKGYTFVCHTGNMVFVRSDLTRNLPVPNPPESGFLRHWVPQPPKKFGSFILGDGLLK